MDISKEKLRDTCGRPVPDRYVVIKTISKARYDDVNQHGILRHSTAIIVDNADGGVSFYGPP